MDAMGNIDAHKFDAYLFSLDFEKHGATYTFSEDNSVRTGHAVGTGIFAGGGNVEPEGQVLTATSITSLPLKPERLPSRKMGEILETVNLDWTFTGTRLLVASMIAEGQGTLIILAQNTCLQQAAMMNTRANRFHRVTLRNVIITYPKNRCSLSHSFNILIVLSVLIFSFLTMNDMPAVAVAAKYLWVRCGGFF